MIHRDIHSSGIRLIGIVGGSGSGKTWLAERLMQHLGGQASRISLDDFYWDRSHLTPERRARINFDQPSAIEWPILVRTLEACRDGATQVQAPHYDFTTHTRSATVTSRTVMSVVIVDGLWLYHRESLRALFDLKLFMECSAELRLRRRIERDVASRGRTSAAVLEQFASTVLPMHERHVQPQSRWADEQFRSPMTEPEVEQLAGRVQGWAAGGALSTRTISIPVSN